MIRRVIIFTFAFTSLTATLCLLSYARQFGYVGSRFTIGMRQGMLWHVWRSAPLPNSPGFYFDEGSDTNRAMYGINQYAKWVARAAWRWVLGFPVFIGYVLLLVPASRVFKRFAPRWVAWTVVALALVVVLISTATYFATAEYFRPPIFLSLAEGMMEVCVGQASQARFPPPPNGLSLEWGRSWSFSRDQYFMYVSGWGLVLNVPLGYVCLLLVPLSIAFLGRRFPSGHCRRCGYDLTGNISGICPECGQNIEAREAPAAKSSLVSPPNR